jgi:hypothetical protein
MPGNTYLNDSVRRKAVARSISTRSTQRLLREIGDTVHPLRAADRERVIVAAANLPVLPPELDGGQSQT